MGLFPRSGILLTPADGSVNISSPGPVSCSVRPHGQVSRTLARSWRILGQYILLIVNTSIGEVAPVEYPSASCGEDINGNLLNAKLQRDRNCPSSASVLT